MTTDSMFLHESNSSVDSGALLRHFDSLCEAKNAIPRLRQLILNLAIRGKLVQQDLSNESAFELLKRVRTEKKILVQSGVFGKVKTHPSLEKEAAPFNVPDNWCWSQLAEIGFLNPRNFKADDILASFVPMCMIFSDYGTPNKCEKRPWREIKSGYTHFAEGDVALAKITPCFENGKSTVFKKLAGGFGAGTTELHVVRPVIVVPEYILIFLKSPHFIESGIPKMTGTAGQKRISSSYFAYTPFPLPPLSEQHRIVAKVSELMALCDKLERAQFEKVSCQKNLASASYLRLDKSADIFNPSIFDANVNFHINNFSHLTAHIDQIRQLRDLILNLAIRGQLVPQSSNEEVASLFLKNIQAEKLKLIKEGKIKKSNALLPVDKSEVKFKLPSGWELARLGDLCSKTGSGSTPRGGKAAYVSNGIPFLRSQNVYNDGLRLDDVAYISDEIHERMNGSEVYAGDLLLNITGGSIGRCAIVPPTFSQGNINQHVAIIRPVIDSLKVFLHCVILSPYFQNAILQAQTGAGREGLPKNKMDEIVIPLPPVDEQERIIAKVNKLMNICNELEAQISISAKTYSQLLETILQPV